MIRGAVNSHYELIVQLRVRGPDGTEATIDAIIDSGFTSSLTLPEAVATTLGLSRESEGNAMLADGTTCQFDICPAEVEWGGEWRKVLVYVIGGGPLMGMKLLAGHKLMVEVLPGGTVEIAPLVIRPRGTTSEPS